MVKAKERLRVALIAGSLYQGGAEKQLLYMARALLDAGVEVKVYSLTKGEYYESAFVVLGLQPIWFGRFSSPIARIANLVIALRSYRPHIIQSSHFFVNLYVAIVARILGAISIGCIRSDVEFDMEEHGIWRKALLEMPSVLLVNSYSGRENAVKIGINNARIYVLFNVIDLYDFDARVSFSRVPKLSGDTIRVVTIARLIQVKRLERFLIALADARKKSESLKGIIIGNGPERRHLEMLAVDLGLLPDSLLFLGRRDDVPDLLHQADVFMLTSDHEGFPNVLLEASAAYLPIITTPAGDSGMLVKDNFNGYVVPFNDIHEMVIRLIRLAESRELRNMLGRNGRNLVEQRYSFTNLGGQLLSIYKNIAERQGGRRLQQILLT